MERLRSLIRQKVCLSLEDTFAHANGDGPNHTTWLF